ncbi:K(+)-insensitive pyrophosphate-energized proton pump [Candidatus Sulfotelmatomonas gaucii]|uniref:K(+)-insensitive pyrophosphate-energized proton pump n=1 Tax=Candidatus Sulfuritelmatomonas gaucii TaxID=2043161 RepID=A0A2N9M5H2_9BACT|nr:K(+)-insensitive pyrophosphate-energized proton pump [Candidatus Sulfotelmatomonas gaucii]
MTVLGWVYFSVGVSMLSLFVAAFFTRQVMGSEFGKAEMQPISAGSRREGIGESMKSNLFSWRRGRQAGVMAALVLLGKGAAFAAPVEAAGGEANLKLPDLTQVQFLGMNGHSLLMYGPLFCILGMIFGLFMYVHLKGLPVHRSMKEVSQLIWETCKTYLFNQGKFLLLLWSFIAVVILVYFAVLLQFSAARVIIILAFSVLGMAGSYFVAWFGIRLNTLANSRTAYAALSGNAYRTFSVPLKSGMSIGMMLISIELLMMFSIILFVPGDYAGPCFIGFAIGESLGAAVLRLAGGIFTKIADIGADLMKIVFHVKEDDARNPGVIADCTGDNAGDSVGPTADGFETYGVVQVALIAFIMLGAKDAVVGVQLLVWLFAVRVAMLVAAVAGYYINEVIARAKYGKAREFNFESPLTSLVWITSVVTIAVTYPVTYILIPNLGGDPTLWWKLATITSCGTVAGALIPELVKVFTSTKARHVQEVVASAREGGAALGLLSGFVAGNFSAYYLGGAVIVLMALGYAVSTAGFAAVILAAPMFAFGLVAFGFLGMGPVTIAVDSFGPVTDNAQSIYELSLIENEPGVREEVKKQFGVNVDFDHAKKMLEAGDGAGNTFKASAKPVLIGTAVVGATTLIFATIMALTNSLTTNLDKLSILNAPFLLGLVTGGAVIYWFTGAATQAVTTGAYRAVEFIKRNIHIEGSTKASTEDSKKVVAICTRYAQSGMLTIFISLFFAALAFAFLDPFFFVGYLISIAIFGLYQAIFMANAGGAWDNAKKIVEVDLHEKGTPLHEATVVGDLVGDPFKDTAAVALNPVIKFTTLFGLLAVELAVQMSATHGEMWTHILAAVFFLISFFFVYRSFYGMRIKND